MSLFSELQAANNPASPTLSPDRNIDIYRELLSSGPLSIRQMEVKLGVSHCAVRAAVWRLKARGYIKKHSQQSYLGARNHAILYCWFKETSNA